MTAPGEAGASIGAFANGETARAAPWAPARWWSREMAMVAAIVLLGVALRVLWISYAQPDPSDGRFDDSRFYDNFASRIANWEGYIMPDEPAELQWAPGYAGGYPTAVWPPGYPALLAVPYKLFGHDPAYGRFINVAAAGVSIALVYAIGQRLFSRQVGLIAAALLAVFPGQIFFASLIVTESVFTTLLLALVWVLVVLNDGPRPPPVLAAAGVGLLLGAMALVRSEGVMLVLVALAFWRLLVPSWRAMAPHAGLLLLGTALVVAPWTVRNYVTMDGFVLTSSGGSHTFWAGHHADIYADGGLADIRAALEREREYEELPYPERELRFEQDLLEEALRYAVSHPGIELRNLGLKAYYLFRDDASALDWVQIKPVIPKDDVTVLAGVANGVYYVVLLLAVLGLALDRRWRDRRHVLLLLTMAVWVATHLLFLPNPRYHAPLIPIISLAAACGAVAMYERLRSSSRP
ncbi:MAG: glycosyltransferase family 39 protein [Dehalococcoidia bacterium]